MSKEKDTGNGALFQGKAGVFQEDPLTEALREKVGEMIQGILKEEIDAILGAGSYQRVQERLGYRHGTERRSISTSLGRTMIDRPRGRMFKEDGSQEEWQSQILPRYHRRAKAIDDAIISTYLCGTNTRRIKKALRPMLKGVPLSKSVVSRLVGKLKEAFEAWRSRSLSGQRYVYIYADAINIKVRAAGRVVRVPILAVVGVRESGEKELLALELRGSESQEAWTGVLRDLVNRGLNRPKLVIADGNKGLINGIETLWPGVQIQRCTIHKLRNLLAHAPVHAHEEIRADFHRIVNANSLEEAKSAYDGFVKKWSKRLEGVVKSLAEAGEQLITFFRYPKAQWRSLHSTNVIERVNGEFRRRVKTQSSFPTEESVLILLFGLYATGQVQMNRLWGYEELSKVIEEKRLIEVA
jgi:transposase-like protein